MAQSDPDAFDERLQQLEDRVARAEGLLTGLRTELGELREARRQSHAEAAPAKSAASAAEIAPPPAASIETPAKTATPAARQSAASHAANSADSSPVRTPREPAPWLVWLRARANELRARLGGTPLEAFLGMNLLNRLGILILVAGLSFLLKLAYDWANPLLRIGLLALLSLVGLVIGEILYRRVNFRWFGLGLVAGASALLYFTAYAAYNVDAARILQPEYAFFGFLALFIVSALLVANSVRYDSQTLTGFLYFLSFLTIALHGGDSTGWFAPGALALLAGSLVLTLVLKRWKYLSLLGLLATYSNYFLHASALPQNDAGDAISGAYLQALAFLAIYWIIFAISAFSMRIQSAVDARLAGGIHSVNAIVFFALVACVRLEGAWPGLFELGLLLAAIYFAFAALAKQLARPEVWKTSFLLGAAFAALAPPFYFSERALALVWLFEGFVLIGAGFVLRDRWLRYPGYAVFLIAIALMLIFPAGDISERLADQERLLIFEAERALLYLSFAIACFALPLFARRSEERSDVDRFALPTLGAFGVLALTLLGFAVLLAPLQAYLLVPAALVLFAMQRMFGVRSYGFFAAALLAIGAFIALPILFANLGGRSDLDRAAALVLLGLSGLLAVAYLRRISPWRDAAPEDWLALLFPGLPAAAFASLILYQADLRAATALTLVVIAGLLLLQRVLRSGALWAAILGAYLFFLTSALYIRDLVDPEGGRAIEFLLNAGVLWAGLAATFAFAGPLARGLQIFQTHDGLARVLRNAASLFAASIALQILERLTEWTWTIPAIAAYAAALALAAGLLRDGFSGWLAAALALLALITGPVAWTLQFLWDASSLDVSMLQFSLWLMFAAAVPAALALDRERSAPRDLAWVVALAGAILYVFVYASAPYRPSGYALLALAQYYLLYRLDWRRPRWFMHIPFGLTIAMYLYLLVLYAGDGTPLPPLLRAIVGAIPLALLGFSAFIHASLYDRERASPFQRFAFPGILLLFVLLTMSLIDSGWWSLVWAAEAAALLALGILRRAPLIRYGGFALVLIALLKLGLWDMRFLDSGPRVAVLVGVGLMLVAVSYGYARFKDRLFPDE